VPSPYWTTYQGASHDGSAFCSAITEFFRTLLDERSGLGVQQTLHVRRGSGRIVCPKKVAISLRAEAVMEISFNSVIPVLRILKMAKADEFHLQLQGRLGSSH
jgi:hypothetical protein